MRKKIVAANWKMNKTLPEALMLVEEILLKTTSINCSTIIFPPFPFIHTISGLINNREDFYLGAQNLHDQEYGAFTGEVSASAISSVGAKFVLVGHSERRIYFKEDGQFLKNKINTSLKNNLIPIYCFGESLAERESEKFKDVIQHQLSESLFHLNENEIKNIVLAYEPVWAIGTGMTATPAQAQEIHFFVRRLLENRYSSPVANSISILYGGSCNAQNAKQIFEMNDIDGGLIGGASLKADDFVTIINAF